MYKPMFILWQLLIYVLRTFHISWHNGTRHLVELVLKMNTHRKLKVLGYDTYHAGTDCHSAKHWEDQQDDQALTSAMT